MLKPVIQEETTGCGIAYVTAGSEEGYWAHGFYCAQGWHTSGTTVTMVTRL